MSVCNLHGGETDAAGRAVDEQEFAGPSAGAAASSW